MNPKLRKLALAVTIVATLILWAYAADEFIRVYYWNIYNSGYYDGYREGEDHSCYLRCMTPEEIDYWHSR